LKQLAAARLYYNAHAHRVGQPVLPVARLGIANLRIGEHRLSVGKLRGHSDAGRPTFLPAREPDVHRHPWTRSDLVLLFFSYLALLGAD